MQPPDSHACPTNKGGTKHIQNGISSSARWRVTANRFKGNGSTRTIQGLHTLLLIQTDIYQFAPIDPQPLPTHFAFDPISGILFHPRELLLLGGLCRIVLGCVHYVHSSGLFSFSKVMIKMPRHIINTPWITEFLEGIESSRGRTRLAVDILASPLNTQPYILEKVPCL